jgi:alpha-1,6-mannosyltransferase
VIRRLAPALLGITTALTIVVAVLAGSARGSSLRVGGVEHGDRGSVAFLAALALGFATYAGALVILRRRDGNVAAVCALAAAIQLIPLAGPLLLSHDVYSYWAYARIADRHDRDPYTVPPARFPTDPATRAVARGWRGTTSVYGPAFTASSIVVEESAGSSRDEVAFAFRTAAALGAIGATLLAAFVARRKAFAAAFVGWNPLLAVSFAGGGHNDALMLLLMLGALALTTRGKDFGAGVLWVFAAAVKAPALLLLPLQLVRARPRTWAGAVVVGVLGSVTATFAFGTSWLAALTRLGRHEARFAVPVRLEALGLPDTVVHVLAAGVLVIGGLWLLRQARSGRPRFALGACLLVVTSPWLLPWYATWPVALAAAEEDVAAQVFALALAAYLLPDRVPV